MTLDELLAELDKQDDFLKFDAVQNKRSQRPDLHAFLLLDSLVPGSRDMVVAAEHDEIYLDVDLEALAAIITVEQVQELRRCGVHESENSLMLFV